MSDTNPDMRSREKRVLDAIFETPQSVIDAGNAGRAYAYADDGRAADFSTFDTSPEATAFWEGCHEATKQARALADAIGPPVEDHPSMAARHVPSPSAPTEDDREAVARVADALFAQRYPGEDWVAFQRSDNAGKMNVTAGIWSAARVAVAALRFSPVAPSEDVASLTIELPRLIGTRDAARRLLDQLSVPADLTGTAVTVSARQVLTATRSFLDELTTLLRARHPETVQYTGASDEFLAVLESVDGVPAAAATVESAAELPVGSVFLAYYYPPAYAVPVGLERTLARLQLTRGRSIVHGERFECSLEHAWERIEVLFRPDREEIR